ncbi:MAG: polysaccharide deacetylase family protein, partial [Frankia sp.]
QDGQVLDAASGQRAEAQRARNDLADILGREPTAFAYPYGAHDATARAAVRAAGYTCAFATGERAARPEDDVLAISRLTVRAVTAPRTLVSWLTTDQPPAPERGRARPARGALYAATTRLVRRPWTTLAGRGGSPVGPGIPADREAMSVRRSTLGSRPNQSHVPTQAQAVRPGSTPGGLGCGRPVVTLELPDQIPPRSTSASDRSRSADHDGPIRP